MRMILLAGVLVAAVTVSAAPKPTTPSTIALHPSSDVRLGGWVLFEVEAAKQQFDRYRLSVQVLCYQEGHVVFAGSMRPEYAMLLGGYVSPWLESGGPAICVADLYYWTHSNKLVVLATTDFDAAG